MIRVTLQGDGCVHLVDSHNGNNNMGITGCQQPYYVDFAYSDERARKHAQVLFGDVAVTCLLCTRHWRW